MNARIEQASSLRFIIKSVLDDIHGNPKKCIKAAQACADPRSIGSAAAQLRHAGHDRQRHRTIGG